MMLTRKEWLVVAVEAWYYVFMFISAMAALRVQSALSVMVSGFLSRLQTDKLVERCLEN